MNDPTNRDPFANQTNLPVDEPDKVLGLHGKLIRPDDQTRFYFVAGMLFCNESPLGHGTLICCADAKAQGVIAERMRHEIGCDLPDHKHEVLTGIARYGRG